MSRALLFVSLAVMATSTMADDLGRLSANPFGPESTSNPFSPAGSPFSPTSVNNRFGQYGSPFSAQSATNPYASDPPKLYDQQGRYRGELSSNAFAPDSISNPMGRYGNPFSPDSINNPFGAGNPFAPDSPTNPFGTGWRIEPGTKDVQIARPEPFKTNAWVDRAGDADAGDEESP